MGILQNTDSGARRTLPARLVVGRSRRCDLRLQQPQVSGEHATVAWDGKAWIVRDLGSRNGTWVAGERLVGGGTAPLEEGATVSFGDKRETWRLYDAGPPAAVAESADGRRVIGSSDLLLLPDPEHPSVTLFLDHVGWFAEDESHQWAVSDNQTLTVGEDEWRLSLPTILAATVDDSAMQRVSPAWMTLRLAVSRDQEHVETTVFDGRVWHTLAPRSYHYMLVVLAQARLQDEDGSPAERGFMHIDDLSQALALDSRTINVHICRVRQQFAALGIDNAAGIIERRPGVGQLRLGIPAVEVTEL